jgi:hypothetical protein
LATTALTSGSVTTISGQPDGRHLCIQGRRRFVTITTLQTAIAAAVTAGQLSAGTALTLNAGGQAVISNAVAGDVLTATTTDSVLGGFNSSGVVGGTGATVFTSDGTGGGAASLTTAITALSSGNLLLSSSNLSTAAAAKSALTAITAAINHGRRGTRRHRRISQPTYRRYQCGKHRSSKPDQFSEQHPECGHCEHNLQSRAVQHSGTDRLCCSVAVEFSGAERTQAAAVTIIHSFTRWRPKRRHLFFAPI